MDDRWLNDAVPSTVKRRYGQYGPKYIDVYDFLQNEFKTTHRMEFQDKGSGSYQSRYTFTMIEREEDYAVFLVECSIVHPDSEAKTEHRVYLSIRPWDGMEEILGPRPFTVQTEGKSNTLKQLNGGTFAFSKFFGLCYCELLDID